MAGSPTFFWIGDAVGGDIWSNGNAWSLASGGLPWGTAPTLLTPVKFDAGSSRPCTVDAGAHCVSMDCTGYVGVMTLAAALLVNGNFKLVAGMTFNHGNQQVQMSPQASANIDVGGKTLYDLVLDVPTAGQVHRLTSALQLANDLIVKSTTGFASTFQNNEFDLTVGRDVAVTTPALAVLSGNVSVTRRLRQNGGGTLSLTYGTKDVIVTALGGYTPPTPPPPPPGVPIAVAPIIPAGAVQFQGGFTYNPVLLTPWNVVGDWGLIVNQPTYAFNSFFVNSVSGAPAPGQTIEFRCAIPPGRYTFRVWAPRGPDCGIFNVAMNGVPLLVAADLYDPALTPGSVLAVPIVVTAEGLQSIVFTVTGKNALSSNFYLRMHQFQLVPYLLGVL